MKQSITLEVLGANVTKVWLGSKTILFSYNTPVAVWVDGVGYQLQERISATTTKHLGQYGPRNAIMSSAAELAGLIEGTTG